LEHHLLLTVLPDVATVLIKVTVIFVHLQLTMMILLANAYASSVIIKPLLIVDAKQIAKTVKLRSTFLTLISWEPSLIQIKAH
jgi:hypothetical protein